MNMLKDGRLLKRVVVILAFCLLVGNVGSFETNAFASNPGELPDQIEVNGMLLQKVDTSDANYEEPKPLNDFVRPEEQIIDKLSQDIHGGYFYDDNDVANIFALKGRENELAQSISVSTKNRTGSAPTIVIIEPENSKVRGVEKTVYSMQELEDAKKLLLDQYETLGIVGVGFYGLENSLAIYVNDGADKNAITQASPVKNIVFREADSLGLGVEDTSDIPSSLPSTRAINALKGGDWLQRSSGSNWSTLTNSAIYAYGKSNQQIGFMTIGHGYTERQKVYHGGQLVGTATRVHYENYYDVAFIESPYRSYGYMSDGTTRVTEKTMPKSNLTVTAYRAKSGKASGKILDIDIDGYWTTEGKTKYFEEVFTTNISTQNGDSGACYVYGGYAMVGHLIGGYGGYSVSAGLPVYLTMETDIQPAK